MELATATHYYSLKPYLMKYLISYTHSLGEASVIARQNDVASILRNMAHLAVCGHQYSNVTITKV